MTASERDEIVTDVKGAERLLKCSEGHLRNHLDDIPHFYIGSSLRFSVEALRDWARRQAEEYSVIGSKRQAKEKD